MKDKDTLLLEKSYEEISKWSDIEEFLQQNKELVQRMMDESWMSNTKQFIIAALKNYMSIKD